MTAKMMTVFVALWLSQVGCVFDAEPAKDCYYEATIGCGPDCQPRVVQQMIVCPLEPPTPDAGTSTPQ